MKKRIFALLICAVTLVALFALASCGQSKKEPETIAEEVAYIIDGRFESAGYKANIECDNDKNEITVTVTKDKHEEISLLNTQKYLSLATRPGKFSLFMLNFDESYFEIFDTDEVEKVDIKKSGDENYLKLTVGDSTRTKYHDATETAIDLESTIFVVLDNEIIGGYLPEEPVDSNEIVIDAKFNSERAGTVKGVIENGIMPCQLSVLQTSFDEKGDFSFVVKIMPEPSQDEIEPAAADESETAADGETEEATEAE